MWRECVVARLVERGELWRHAPGLIGLRGETLRLFRALEARLAALAGDETADDWRVPQGVTLETLARAEYFESFPGWLTAASHLRDDRDALEAVARADDPAHAARSTLAPASAALPPAVCYHTYAALAGRTIAPLTMTAQATCWRHEGERLAPLERGWAFTMREVVRLGDEDDVEAFRRRGMEAAVGLAFELGLRPTVQPATDPFFAPTARGRQVLQRMKGLKHELTLPIGGGRSVAAASFNHHETHFGDAFDITLPGGAPAHSGCVAFGVERWLLALLVEHGEPEAAVAALSAGAALAAGVTPSAGAFATPTREVA